MFLRLATKKQTMKKKHLNQTFPGDTQPLTQVKNHQSGRNQKERQAKIYQVSTWKEENSQPVQDVKKKKNGWSKISLVFVSFQKFFHNFQQVLSKIYLSELQNAQRMAAVNRVHLNNTSSLGQEGRVLSLHLLIAFFKRYT